MRLVPTNPVVIATVLAAMSSVEAFHSQSLPQSRAFLGTTSSTSLLVAGLPNLDEVDNRSFMLSREDVKPLITLGEGDKEKVVNAFGLWCLFVSLVTGPLWMMAMIVTFLLSIPKCAIQAQHLVLYSKRRMNSKLAYLPHSPSEDGTVGLT